MSYVYGASIPRWINKALDQGKYITASAPGFHMRVVRIKSMHGVWFGRHTNGDWTALPGEVVFTQQ